MARLSKNRIKQHEQAIELLESSKFDSDNPEMVRQILIDLTPQYMGHVSKNAAFFTPPDLGHELALMTATIEGRILDLAAGIGSLMYGLKAHNLWSWDDVHEVYAVELNLEYVDIGRKLFPQVNWVCGNIFDCDLINSLGEFDFVVSNPPFGRVVSGNGVDTTWLNYQGSLHLMAAEIALNLTDAAGFILPMPDLPFEVSNGRGHQSK